MMSSRRRGKRGGTASRLKKSYVMPPPVRVSPEGENIDSGGKPPPSPGETISRQKVSHARKPQKLFMIERPLMF